MISSAEMERMMKVKEVILKAMAGPSFYARRSTSLPATRSDTRSGPKRIMSTCGMTRKKPSRGGAFVGIQMDSHHLSMLAGRKTYDEEIYVQSLRRLGSLLGAALGPTTPFGYMMVPDGKPKYPVTHL
jgi:hypothetical protein